MDLRSNKRKRDLRSLTIINVDECDYSENYNVLVDKICSKRDEKPWGTYVYSSEKIHNAFKSLPDRDKEIIIKRYGVMDGKYRSLKEVGTILGISSARVRELEERAIRRLRGKNKASCFIVHLDEKLVGYVLSEEEKSILENAKKTILISKDENEIKAAKETLNKYMSSLASKVTPDRITLEDLCLTWDAYWSLDKAGIKTLGDILQSGRLDHTVCHSGSKKYKELSDRVRDFGYDINTESKIETIETKEETVVKDDSIEMLRTATEELKTTIEEKEERSKLLDEYIKLARQHAKLKETESKIDEEIRQKEEILKGFGFRYEK